MRKALVCFTVCSLVIMLGTTALAQKAAPKTLCFTSSGSSTPVVMMSLKNQGTIKTIDGPVKYYSVHGTYFLHSALSQVSPLTGTATFINGTLHFNLMCILRSDGEPGSEPDAYYRQVLTEGTYDTVAGSGLTTTTYINIGGTAGSAVTIGSRFNSFITDRECTLYSVDSLSAMGETSADLTEDALNIE